MGDNFINLGKKGKFSGIAIYTVPNKAQVVRVSKYKKGKYVDGVYVFLHN